MQHVTREQLYTLVWEKPISKLAEAFGVSDVAIHKVCKKRRIPTPGLGYWAKVQAGQKPPREELPKDTAAERGWVVFRGNGLNNLPAETRQAIQQKRAALKEAPYVMPAEDAPLHKAALRLQDRLESARVDKDGLIRILAKDLVALELSPACKDRAVRILNALFFAIEQRGGIIEPGENALQFRVENEIISLKVTEKRDRLRYIPNEKEQAALDKWEKECEGKRKRGEYISKWQRPNVPEWDKPLNGQLWVQLDEGAHWDSLRRGFADGKQQKLEELIPKIALAALAIAAGKQEQRRKRAEQAQEWADQAKRREIAQRQQALEEKRRQLLLQDIEQRRQAEAIRAYADQIEATLGDATAPEVWKWLRWARAEAGRLDPLTQGLPVLLQDEGLAELQRAYATGLNAEAA